MGVKEITGWHVLAIFGTAFAIIISVNLTLAFKAVSTFPGLETKNSYVASQAFQKNKDEQLGLNWQVSARASQGKLHLKIDDPFGPVIAEIVTATLGRATHVGQDQFPQFKHNGRFFEAPIVQLENGNWNLRLVAKSQSGKTFQQRVIVEVTP